MATKRGKVKWWNESKGYGFITPDDGSKDHFVHHSNIDDRREPGRDRLGDGQAVEFESSQDTKGPKAINVRGV